MRTLFLLLVTVMTLFACNTAPDNVIYGQDIDVTVKPADSSYMIRPTLGQSFHLAKAREDRSQALLLSFAFFLMFGVLLYAKFTSANWFPQSFDENLWLYSTALFATLGTSLLLFLSMPLQISGNNEKWVKKAVYDKAMTEAGSTQPIWDSLSNNCLIVNGNYGCKK